MKGHCFSFSRISASAGFQHQPDFSISRISASAVTFINNKIVYLNIFRHVSLDIDNNKPESG